MNYSMQKLEQEEVPKQNVTLEKEEMQEVERLELEGFRKFRRLVLVRIGISLLE